MLLAKHCLQAKKASEENWAVIIFFYCENIESKKKILPQKKLKNQNLKNINKQMNQRNMKPNSKQWEWFDNINT